MTNSRNNEALKPFFALAVAILATCLAIAALPSQGLALGLQEEESGQDPAPVYFSLTQDQVSLDAGGILRIGDYVKRTDLADDQTLEPTTHFDYVPSDASLLSGTRHQALKIAAAPAEETTVDVRVCCVRGTGASGSANEPCEGQEILQEETLHVTIAAGPAQEATYGPQGTDLTIEATSPEVASSTVSGSTYRNVLPPQEAKTTLSLALKHSAGMAQFQNYWQKWGFTSLINAYRGVAGSKMTYISPTGNRESVSAYGGNVGVANITSTGATLKIPLGSVTGTAYLIIHRDLHTFVDGDRSQPNKYLGADIVFEIPVVESTYVKPDPKPLEGSAVQLAYESTAYDSSYKKPGVLSVTLADGTVVYDGFFVSYRDNVEPGTATAVVTGDGQNCSGSTEATFAITKGSPLVDSAKSTYAASFGGKPFGLGAMTSGDGALSYRSSDARVAAVSSTGAVTVKGAGTARITITSAETDRYFSSSATVTVKVAKGTQKLALASASKAVKRGGSAALSVKGAKGAKSFRKASGSSLLTVTSTGRVKVSKKAKRGKTLSVKVKVTAKGDANYKAASKTFTVKVKVK